MSQKQHLALFEELNPTECNFIVQESVSNGKKAMHVHGIFMQAAIKNRNERVYPLTEIARVVAESQNVIKSSGGIAGELDHPQTLQVSLDRISHLITELRMEGNNAVGKAKLLDTPTGLIAQKLIEGGVRLGISSRGAGAVDDSGLVEGFQFITADLVAHPSAPSAIMTPVYESLEHLKSGKHVLTLAEAVKHDPAAQKYFEQEIMKFIMDLEIRPNRKI
jgi:hypothetical protein